MLPFRWTPAWEALLEDLLMKYYFDFHQTSKEFSRLINADLPISQHYAVDAKQLQLRWTDVEIRKYRLHQDTSDMQASTTAGHLEDDLPPLEEPKKRGD